MPQTVDLLHDLVAAVGLPEVAAYEPLRGHGFDHEILLATLADGRRVVLRHRPSHPRALPVRQARFLEEHDVPAPRLLGGNDEATLYEYVPGEMLSALVVEGRMTDAAWRSVGGAFRRLHDVRFPALVEGRFGPDGLTLTPTDPVARLHDVLRADESYLKTNLPEVVPHLPRVHDLIDEFADQLREPTALLHRDVNPSNIIVGSTETTLIDWDDPRVGDPAAEIAALEEHIYLIDRTERLPDAFYESYGERRPAVGLYRLTGAIGWYASGDFEEWHDLAPDLHQKSTTWRTGLATYLSTIANHLDRLHHLTI
jgi:aminoglycoside phosphotransferase (APT) family kinase protein